MPDEIRRDFITRIEDLRAIISNRYKTLNLKAIFLFVVTLVQLVMLSLSKNYGSLANYVLETAVELKSSNVF